jgi:gamma-glutamyl:cysteine ligase YbdK (ATP-grasp superfamily)
MDSDLAADVDDVLAVDGEEFQARVEEDAEVIKSEIGAGTFNNPQAIVGLEYEFYAVTGDRWEAVRTTGGPSCSLARVPRRLLEHIGFEKELGLHNAEMTTSPQPFNEHGLAAQEAEVRARLSAAQAAVQAEGLRLVSDGMWTIPPAGETARSYLTDSVEDRGVRIASNMSDSARYHAMANSQRSARMVVDAPHVHLAADTVMPESLITSIQPHYQVAHATDLPTYFRYALRFAAPLLALGVNSPFFPPDLYDADATPEEILRDAHDEHRVGVFESVLNGDGHEKVRFPRDVATVEEAVDRVAADETMVPMPVGDGDRFDDEFAHFRRKHGTYWRWVRPVFGGPTRSDANARIEFRPIPAQPTVRDSAAFQAAFAGLLDSFTTYEHPLVTLDWERAEENFYAAARDGLDAEMVWITNAGAETTDYETVYADLFDHAQDGLQSRGLTEEESAKYLWPLRQRARHRVTPASWKREQVRDRLDDGAAFADAMYGMQREYVERQADTLVEGSFADWLGRGRQEL